MRKAKRRSILESIPILILLGVLAGVIGGIGVGLVQMRASSTTTATSK